jgi:hypothetical protein
MLKCKVCENEEEYNTREDEKYIEEKNKYKYEYECEKCGKTNKYYRKEDKKYYSKKFITKKYKNEYEFTSEEIDNIEDYYRTGEKIDLPEKYKFDYGDDNIKIGIISNYDESINEFNKKINLILKKPNEWINEININTEKLEVNKKFLFKVSFPK